MAIPAKKSVLIKRLKNQLKKVTQNPKLTDKLKKRLETLEKTEN
jgi:hypothetical protein